MARIVFTGFEAFQSFSYNPSIDVATAAAVAAGGSPDAHCEVLDVTWTGAASHGARLIEAHPDLKWLIHVGLAAHRDYIALEREAHNRRGTAPDNNGVVGMARLLEDGPDTLWSAAPSLGDFRSLSSGVEVRFSDDAGEYVCNAILFASLQAAAGTDVQVAFVHVPSLSPEMARLVGTDLGEFLRDLAAGPPASRAMT